MMPASLAGRILEPLTHPWSAVIGGLLSTGMLAGDRVLPVVRVAWRLLRVLLVL